ncbi:MAG: L,D-transpeptidase [Gemmatimonadota bacterium]
MTASGQGADRRGAPAGEERRDHSPPGRLRRISFDHRAAVWAMAGVVLVTLALFAATTAFAINERFERNVAEIAYTRDAQAVQFLLGKEAEALRQLNDTVAVLEERVGEMASGSERYLVVSIAERRVWYVDGRDTVFTAPVAVGSGTTMVLGGRTQRFQTPRGRLSITHKELDPIWVPPDWHYQRIAQQRSLRVVNMSNEPRDALTRRGFAPGQEPIADGVIYIPPWGSPQRKHTGVLGAAKLEMRDGYYFHGTNNEASIGTAASAGCIRMRRADILWMYENVPVGTEVYIY